MDTRFWIALLLAPVFLQGEPLARDYASQPFRPIDSLPARFDTQGSWDFALSASFTYLFAVEDTGVIGETLSTASPFFPSYAEGQGPLLLQKLEYKPGFKVGAQLNTPFDSWNVDAEYLWYRGVTRSTFQAESPYYFQSSSWMPGPFDTFFSRIDAGWKLGIDDLSLTLSRPFYSGERWAVTPSFGLRSLWVRQTMHVAGTALLGNPDQTHFYASAARYQSWGIGPAGNLNSSFLFSYGLSLFGDAGLSLLYTRYSKITNHGADYVGNTTTLFADDFKIVRPVFDMDLGLSWGRYLRDETLYLFLSASYDFTVFIDQNVLNFVIYGTSNSTSPGNLVLHGLNLTASIQY